MSTNQPQQSDKEHDNTASHIVVGSGSHDTVFRRAIEQLQFIVRRIFGMARYRLIAIGAIFCILIMAGAWLAVIKLPSHNPPPNTAGSASKSGNNKSEVDS